MCSHLWWSSFLIDCRRHCDWWQVMFSLISARLRCPRLAVPESGKNTHLSSLYLPCCDTPSVLHCASVVPDLPSLAHPFDSSSGEYCIVLFSQEIFDWKILFGIMIATLCGGVTSPVCCLSTLCCVVAVIVPLGTV